jgi:hypothetical protein
MQKGSAPVGLALGQAGLLRLCGWFGKSGGVFGRDGAVTITTGGIGVPAGMGTFTLNGGKMLFPNPSPVSSLKIFISFQ